VLVQGFLGGVAGTILFFSVWLYSITILQVGATITYFVSVGLLGALIVISIINSFTTKTFVHPDDKIFGNTFTFILFMAELLTIGRFFPTVQVENFAYDAGVDVLTAFVFVYLVLYFGKAIGFIEMLETKLRREKELSARFILLAILLGVILVFLKFIFDAIYTALGYNWGVFSIGIATFIVIMIIALLTWRKYEPVSKEAPKPAATPQE
jgi:hypothetical protein